MRNKFITKLASASAGLLCSLMLHGASFNSAGSIEGASGSLQISKQRGEVIFMNNDGDNFGFHVSCSHPERKWFCGYYLDKKDLIIDQNTKSSTFKGTIPALGSDPASELEFSISEMPGGLANIKAKFNCTGDAKKLYNAELKLHVRADFSAEGRLISVDGSPLVFENDMNNTSTKRLYSGKASEVSYQMAPGRILRLFTVNSSNVSVSQLFDKGSGKYYMEIKYEMGSGNSISVNADLGEKSKEVRANVYEGIDYNANRFIVPNYNLSRNLIQNPGFEDGFDYWMFYSLGRITETGIFEHYSIDESTAFEGKRSLKILGEKNQFPAPPATFTIPLQAGAAYTLSFYAKTDKPGFGVISTGGTTDVWGSFIKGGRFELSTEWKRYSYSFSPSNKATTLFLGVDSPKENCTVWLDAVQLEKSNSLSEFTKAPVSASIVSKNRDNLFQPSEKTEAKLRVNTAKTSEKGEAQITVKNFYGEVERKESLKFSTDNGVAILPLAWADELGSGLHIFEIDLKLDSGFSDKRFGRLTKMNYLDNNFKHKNIFCAGSGDGRVGNWERKFTFWERAGFGAAIHFDPPPHKYAEMMAKHKIYSFSAIFYGGGWALNKKYRLDHKPNEDEKSKWITEITDEDLKAIEEEAFKKATEYPEISAWKTINEPNLTPTDEELAASIKVIAAARKGILRANPKAKIISPDPANMSPNSGIKYLDRYFEAGGKELTDIVGIHPYRQHPEDPDLDSDIVSMIAVTDKHFGKNMEIWFTEGMYYMDYNLPAFQLDAFSSPCGGDHSRLRFFSYDLGIGEKMSATNSARYWLACLKHTDRVKMSVDWSAFSNRLFSDIDMKPQALTFASNTLANLLGNSKYIADVDFGENVRCYVFDNGAGIPVAAIWNYSEAVARGSEAAPKLKVANLPQDIKIIDFMNCEKSRPADGLLEINAFPLFLTGIKGKTNELIENLGKTPLIGANVKRIAFQAQFTSSDTIKLSVSNMLAKEQKGTLKLIQDGKEILSKDISLAGKDKFSLNAKVPEGSDSIRKTVFDMEFKSNIETEKASLDFEYFTCRKTGTAMSPDSDPAKWQNLPAITLKNLVEWKPGPSEVAKGIAPKTYGGEKDLSAKLRTSWDSEYFRIAVEVKDEKLVTMDSIDNAWKGDGIQIYFDSWGDARAKRQKGFDHNDQTYDVWIDKDFKEAKVFRRVSPEWQLSFNKQGFVKDVKAAVRKTADGYFLEVSFPKKEIAPIRLEEGTSFGFAVLINDNDDVYRHKGLTLTPAGVEPFQNPQVYPIMILK